MLASHSSPTSATTFVGNYSYIKSFGNFSLERLPTIDKSSTYENQVLQQLIHEFGANSSFSQLLKHMIDSHHRLKFFVGLIFLTKFNSFSLSSNNFLTLSTSVPTTFSWFTDTTSSYFLWKLHENGFKSYPKRYSSDFKFLA